MQIALLFHPLLSSKERNSISYSLLKTFPLYRPFHLVQIDRLLIRLASSRFSILRSIQDLRQLTIKGSLSLTTIEAILYLSLEPSVKKKILFYSGYYPILYIFFNY
jgi:hypothetical protein